jgi:(1->4)-alpha-D-glucan 1-alpha-D-glucosylmutase
MDPTVFDFFREVLLPRDPDDVARPGERRDGYPPADAAESAERLRFSMKFQQYTGPLQAKGLEDTAFYRYNLLLSLNEVGGDPSRFGVSAAEFHAMNVARRHDWPFEMLATATHDTKLGEDVRVRLDVLSEIPDEWGREVSKWMRLNRPTRRIVDGEPAPDRNDEYRFYQALLGIWPPDVPGAAHAPREIVERLQAYMVKAVKEAKRHSSWINPNEPYEQATTAFVERMLTGPGAPKFLAAFLPFEQRIARAAVFKSLSQVALKIASPGVPDFYRGTELWDLVLVDPDNRRDVDYGRRGRALEDADRVLAQPAAERAASLAALLERWTDGTIKMLVTAAGLRLRRDRADLFLEGEYLPLDVETSVKAQVLAFARVHSSGAAVVIAPTLGVSLIDEEHPFPLGDRWLTSRVLIPPSLAEATYRDAFTGASLRPVVAGDRAWIFVGQALERLPVALLVAAKD